MKRWQIITTVVIILSSGIAAVIWYCHSRSGENTASYVTAKVDRGDLVAGINATGTIEPEEVVDVGAQIAGQILDFGKDRNGKTIDYGSQVEEGTVLARIDDTMYTAELLGAEAQKQLADASEKRAEADLKQSLAKLDLAKRDLDRAEKLLPSQGIAISTYDSYKAAFDAAFANKLVGEAAILQANASISSADAVLQKAKRNLSYCTIKSPVNGIVIDRRVNIGQTVVASLNAPSLFLIAKDLKRMQVWVSVNEADIGKIHQGQPVTFTVDAFPGEVFKGEVGKIRLNASMTQNVVAYIVEVVTDNSNRKLLPYLTANVQFEQARRSDVLLVPNAALRWTPKPEQVPLKFHNMLSAENETGGKGKKKNHDNAGEHKTGLVWIQSGSMVEPLKVNVGITNGAITEISGDGVKEGMEVVSGQRIQVKGQPSTTNPFTPQIGNRRR